MRDKGGRPTGHNQLARMTIAKSDGRPPWVTGEAIEVKPGDADWPTYVNAQTHRVWRDWALDTTWVWARDDWYRYQRLDYRLRVSPECMTPPERREHQRLRASLQAQGLISATGR